MTGPEPELGRYGTEDAPVAAHRGWQSMSRAASIGLWTVVFVLITMMSVILAI